MTMHFPKTLYLDDVHSVLMILEQTLLPGEEKYVPLHNAQETAEAIRFLRVRGAPAIGAAAACAYYLEAKRFCGEDKESFMRQMSNVKEVLASSRPTAVNLFWALSRMESTALNALNSLDEVKNALKRECQLILKEDEECCRAIGEYGAALIKDAEGVLTYCNAGALATTSIGTATAPIYTSYSLGRKLKVYASETRPLLQGARLTSFELSRAGVDVTLICDNMISALMRKGEIDAVLVGCDRVAFNGDTANKIGTSGASVLAHYYNIPFYVCCPVSTIDFDCPDGQQIVIEERPQYEITHMWYSRSMAPEGVKAWNPAFDVTPASLITAFITEKGVISSGELGALKNLG
ncbi:MAG: S-methyl-5-thioribose-1-phosphate isomerase [Christensenellaceae bacterium]|nr:S-methyl-5-thioribose-1-phosphate isomerase [Christensenellaceae bacterium]